MRSPRLLGMALASVALAGLAVVRRRLLVVTVRGSSMEPVYHDGDALLATRLPAAHVWRQGEDLVFARTGGQLVPGDPPNLVKRVCAVPGDRDPSRSDAVVQSGWLVLHGLNVTGPLPSYYSVPVEAILAKVISRLPSRPAGSVQVGTALLE